MAERTPLMEQYGRIKSRYRDAILFFRLGDFYEMFFEDAVEASALLDLTLTHRQGEPMCGIPHHAAKPYIARLMRRGRKVAICEQLGEPGIGKGLVERDVVEVVTPGTTVDEDFLEGSENNYLVSICRTGGRCCVASLEVSTGDFRAGSIPDADDAETLAYLRSELARLAPREVLVQQSVLDDARIAQAVHEREGIVLGRYPDWSFDVRSSARELKARFGVASLKGFGFQDDSPELAGAALLLRYVDETAKSAAPQISSLLPANDRSYVGIDEGSRRNLEIVRNISDAGKNYSLLSVLDATRSSPGARLLKQWLLRPLASAADATARLDAVDFLYRDQRLLGSLREILGRVLDTERLAARVAMDRAHARDLLALRDTLKSCREARAALLDSGAPELLAGTLDMPAIDALREIEHLIGASIAEQPSMLLTEGNLIRPGYDGELDALRSLKSDTDAVLEAYLGEERIASGIPSLRIRFNRIIGYYLEVGKSRSESVPSHFIRRQSLVSGDRFSTQRLSELESDINGATEKIVARERLLFLDIRERVKTAVRPILEMGRLAARQDCIASFAWTATARGYTRPVVDDGTAIEIVAGRHPVVEAWLPDSSFVPNGIRVDTEGPSFALITGPNMAGKSTFLRQTALITLMAQCGSFVPAESARIGVVDRIFCRVGAQDNLARGESTFLVEMHETAYILNTASRRSLVIMDEVGRGTSTLDGLSIAWAVSECLLDRIRSRTLFATHYHELTTIRHERLFNLSLAVSELEGDIVFLKRIEDKPAAGSFGIHVARLAGMPLEVLERARSIQSGLARIEADLGRMEGETTVRDVTAGRPRPVREPDPFPQGDLFRTEDLVAAELASLDIDTMTPIQALNRLADFVRRLKS